jgi:hypothetical protein
MKTWIKTNWTDAGQIFDFIGDAVECDATPDELRAAPDLFFSSLVEQQKLREAVFFVGHALPRYEGVVWATRTLLAAGAIERNTPLLNAILRWIDDPDEDLRRAIKGLADAEDSFAPVRMLAMALFTSGGSISQPDLPPVLASPDASAKYASGAILTAAYATPEPQAVMRQAAEIGHAMASQAA